MVGIAIALAVIETIAHRDKVACVAVFVAHVGCTGHIERAIAQACRRDRDDPTLGIVEPEATSPVGDQTGYLISRITQQLDGLASPIAPAAQPHAALTAHKEMFKAVLADHAESVSVPIEAKLFRQVD